jgi:hypothetical protein
MAYIVPDSALRFQTRLFAHPEEIKSFGEAGVMRHMANALAENALRKIINDCLVNESDGRDGQILRVDVYILSPDDLDKIIIEARRKGEEDAMRWMRRRS